MRSTNGLLIGANPGWFTRRLLRWSGLAELNSIADALAAESSAARYAQRALARLGVTCEVADRELAAIPARGGLVFVANHPFGGIDGLIAIALLHARRPDLKLLGHGVLATLEPLRPHVLPINPFGGAAAVRANAAAMRDALEHLQGGGALLMFPAGEVSHLRWNSLRVSDGQWSPTAARLIRRSAAPVVPLHFAGRNSVAFQIAGLLHPIMRTLLLPHELLNKRGIRVAVRIGKPVAPEAMSAKPEPIALASLLRMHTYALASGPHAMGAPAATAEPLAGPIKPDLLQAEVAALPPEQRLAANGDLSVWLARAQQVPCVLREIGRLRELTFRAVGEGTGRSADLDEFDEHYEHLFLWHAAKREIVGAYRLGRIDEIRQRAGVRGLYLATLFDFREPFFALLGPALELGRSFVRPEYQRSYAPLLLLWKGIGAFVGANPRYARLIGPASVSAEYDEISRAMLVQYLRRRRHEPLLAALVKARQPFSASHSLRSLVGEITRLPDVEEVGRLIASREPDGKGIPVLLRQYLRLGARTIGFNIDPQFGDSLDCLILLDLRRTPDEVLRRYLSDEALNSLRRYWGQSRGARKIAAA